MQPLHLAGNNAPVADEREAVPTRIAGALPRELCGTFVRNGPNPVTGWSPHLFAGDGMVHGIALADGEARCYRNRWVRTPLSEDPSTVRNGDPAITTANTAVVAHAGRLLALEEGGYPYELTPDLDTVGPFTFDGALTTPMTAHPKVCPATGELLFFGYQLRSPFVVYHRADAAGRLVASEPITVPGATMMHDFAVTETRTVFHDSPVVFDPTALAAGGPPWRWDDAHGARFGVLPRHGGDADVRWFEIDPCHLSHVANAYDDGERVVVTGTRIAELWRAGSGDLGGSLPTMHRWTIDLANGRVDEEPVDDLHVEYPRVDDAEIGRPHRFVYVTTFVLDAEPDHHEIVRYDVTTGERVVHALPPGHTCGEPVFAEGFLLTFAHDRGTGTSYLLVLDAADVAGAPVAEVHLPLRIPAGFHGWWLPAR